MKAIVYLGKENLLFKKMEKPLLNEGEVLIKVRYAGICGTDMVIYDGKLSHRVTPPLIPGHEFSGEIMEINSSKKYGLKKGDRVTVNPLIFCSECHACKSGFFHVCKSLGLLGVEKDGGFAEYVRASIDMVHKIPDGLSLKVATLVEPLAVAVHCLRRSELKIGDCALVLGGGPIGVLIAQVARIAGASDVIITEVNDFRIDIARKLGFSVINPLETNLFERIMEMTKGNGTDVVFEVAGAKNAMQEAISLVRIRGRIISVALHQEVFSASAFEVIFRELSIVGSRVYEYGDFDRAINILAKDKINGELIISHVLPLREASKAFEEIKKDGEVMKILLDVRQ